MALTHVYVLATNSVIDLFKKSRDRQASNKFDNVKDRASSVDDRPFISISRESRNFLSASFGKLAERYGTHTEWPSTQRCGNHATGI